MQKKLLVLIGSSNKKIHQAQSKIQQFENFKFDVMSWPARSLDVSLIESLSHILDHNVSFNTIQPNNGKKVYTGCAWVSINDDQWCRMMETLLELIFKVVQCYKLLKIKICFTFCCWFYDSAILALFKKNSVKTYVSKVT